MPREACLLLVTSRFRPAQRGADSLLPPSAQRSSLRAASSGVPWHLLACAAALAAGLPAAASAAEPRAGDGTWSIGLYGGKLIKDNLLDIVPHAFEGKITGQNTVIEGVLVRRSLQDFGWMKSWSDWGGIPVFNGLEFGAFHHHGGLDTDELIAAWRVGATGASFGGLNIDLAGSFGVSHAFGGEPYDNPDHHKSSDNYATLFYMAPEVVLHHDALPGWQLGFRIHHRSGIYGLVAPSKVGSNHVGMYLMRDF